MSEEEKRKRDLYKKRRDLWIKILAGLLILTTVLAVAFAFLYRKANETYYINYTEAGSVDYKVYLHENDFFDEEFLGKDQAYVSTLIDNIKADFLYEINMDTAGVEYEYAYKVITSLEIIDKKSGIPLFNPTYSTVEEKRARQNSQNKLTINESVDVDYDFYNNIAKSFIDEYSLGDTESRLTVTMHVSVLSVCDNFAENTKSDYAVALNVPLTNKTVNIAMSSTVPDAESKILACDKATKKDFFMFGAIGSAGFDVILLITFILVIYLTRNRDINYTIRVRKLVSAYKSFIQKITNVFDESGYQLLCVDTFTEMLEIRDTIQSPILMSENEDKTCTRFIIPTNTKLLYVYEIKIDGYDEIYGIGTEPEFVPEEPEAEKAPPAEEPAPVTFELTEESAEENNAEETIAKEEAVIDESAEAPEAETTTAETEELEAVGTDSDDADIEAAAYAFSVRCNYSFEAKLILATDNTKEYYKRIVALTKRYGAKITRSWKRERITLSRTQFATLIFKGSKLGVALALDPKEYLDTKYKPTDLSGIKKYEKTPMLMKLTSDRRAKYSLELLEMLFKNAGLADSGTEPEIAPIPKKAKLTLVSENLIRFEGSEDNVKHAIARIWEKHDKTTPAKTKEELEKAEEPTVAEQLSEAIEEIEETGAPESDGNALAHYVSGVRYDYSFEAKLALAGNDTRDYYTRIITYVKSYGVKVSRSWKRERVYLGRTQFATLIFKGTKLGVALALDPKEYADTKHNLTDLSSMKKYEKTPMLLKVTSERKLKYAIELLGVLFAKASLEDKKLNVKTKAINQRTKNSLMRAGLIRKKSTAVK